MPPRTAPNRHPLITVDPAILGGKPIISGTRIAVELILDRLADGWSYDCILAAYPHLRREHVQAAVAFGADLSAPPPPSVR